MFEPGCAARSNRAARSTGEPAAAAMDCEWIAIDCEWIAMDCEWIAMMDWMDCDGLDGLRRTAMDCIGMAGLAR